MRQVKSYSLKFLANKFQITKERARFIKQLTLVTDKEEYWELETKINKVIGTDLDFDTNCLSMILDAINVLLETYGIEYEGERADTWNWKPNFEICNAGDSYVSTVILDNNKEVFYVGCLVDIA